MSSRLLWPFNGYVRFLLQIMRSIERFLFIFGKVLGGGRGILYVKTMVGSWQNTGKADKTLSKSLVTSPSL